METIVLAIGCLLIGIVIGFAIGCMFILRQLISTIGEGMKVVKTVKSLAKGGGKMGLMDIGMNLLGNMLQKGPQQPQK